MYSTKLQSKAYSTHPPPPTPLLKILFVSYFNVEWLTCSPTSSPAKGLSPEDMKTIRVSLMSLIKYYISRDITYDELDAILKFLFAVKDQDMVCIV